MKRLIRPLSALSTVALILGSGIASPAATARDTNSIKDSQDTQNEEHIKLAMSTHETNSDFALNLFAQSTKQKTGNVLVSPFSAFAALSMTLNGAEGKTRSEMAKSLGLSNDNLDELNKRNEATFAALNKNTKVQIEIANAIYADKSTPFKQSFIELCKKSYGAEIHNENFADPKTVDAINSWCKAKTHGKIDSILDKLNSLEKMVLINAIYFKGTWQNQFHKSQTGDDKFTDENGAVLPIKMMHQNETFSYFKDQNFAAVDLPYLGHNQSLLVFLPDKNTTLSTVQARFNKDNWKLWMNAFQPTTINLSLPKFKIEYSTQLNEALKSLGMADAFDSKTANFSGMIDQPTWIGRVLQKTFMEVNEEGTEAAAATAVTMMSRSVQFQAKEPVEFRVDRPFIVALVDKETQEILFLGTIQKP
ncbi:MAG: serpin family protein [Candidatus Obscuribacterales bacterium]|nr:serpin family protein [Candidatus Obscuribacterales bacterium]